MNIGLFIDGSNIFASAQALDFRIDYSKLLKFYQDMGEVRHAFYFTALPPRDVNSPLRRMIDYVAYNGFNVVQKETKEYVDDLGVRKFKGNMDVEISVMALKVAPKISDMILFSGDGDFRALVESMQVDHGVRCTVVSARTLMADSLRKQANTFVDLSTLKVAWAQDTPAKEEVEKVTVRRRNFLSGS